MPLERWLTGPMRDWAEALLQPDRLRNWLGLDDRAERAPWARLVRGVRTVALPTWCSLMAQARLAREPGVAP